MAADIVQSSGIVGLQNIQEGVIGVPFSQDRAGGAVISFGLAPYHNLTKRGKMFRASAQAAVTFGAGLSATSVFTLYNPIGSPTDAILIRVFFALSAAPAAASVIWLTGPGTTGQATPTATTELANWSSAYLGTNFKGSSARVFTAATLAAAPIVLRPLFSVVAVGAVTPPYEEGEPDGAVILSPGTHVTLQASAAASGFPGFAWYEVPV